MGKTLTRDERHDHYWVMDGILMESYWTIRGMRSRHIMAVAPGTPDMDQVESEVLKLFEQEYDTYNSRPTEKNSPR